jgi:hypothetical protein
MTKKEIAQNLYLLAIDMASIAFNMEKIDDENMKRHAKELRMAAIIANEWSDEINKEIDDGNSDC